MDISSKFANFGNRRNSPNSSFMASSFQPVHGSSKSTRSHSLNSAFASGRSLYQNPDNSLKMRSQSLHELSSQNLRIRDQRNNADDQKSAYDEPKTSERSSSPNDMTEYPAKDDVISMLEGGMQSPMLEIDTASEESVSLNSKFNYSPEKRHSSTSPFTNVRYSGKLNVYRYSNSSTPSENL
jgi:hypothetical protein